MLKPFELLMPKSLDEALAQYAALGSECKIVAGGTDVLVEMHGGFKEPKLLMSIMALRELKGIREEAEDVMIGALTTHAELERSSLICSLFPGLVDGASRVGSVQTRMRGTIGGNICNAVPSGDTLSPLLSLGAKLVLRKGDVERTVAFTDFFVGAKKTILAPGELLTFIRLPKPGAQSSSAYIKFTRREAMDLALLGAAACITLSEDQSVITNAKIGLTTAAPVPFSAKETSDYLIGKAPTPDVLLEAGKRASSESTPRSSWRCSAEYRHDVLEVIVPDAILKAVQRITHREV